MADITAVSGEGNKMNGRTSFAAYLAATRYHAVDHIMTKARVANQLAKTVAGPDQRRLYALKCGFISRALDLAPESLVVDSFDMRQGARDDRENEARTTARAVTEL